MCIIFIRNSIIVVHFFCDFKRFNFDFCKKIKQTLLILLIMKTLKKVLVLLVVALTLVLHSCGSFGEIVRDPYFQQGLKIVVDSYDE